MARRSGERGTRSGQRRRAPEHPVGKRAARATPRTVRHPRFGAIPLVKRNADGEVLEYDLDYRPELPAGAVRGEPRKQSFCPMCHVPRYFYVDEARTCVQCGAPFVFGAAEQKLWYETLGFHFDAIAIRCTPCRRKRRTEGALRAQIAAARAGLRESPGDPALLISFAEATARLRQLAGAGRLGDAIAAARRAFKRWPHGVEALFFEALCHSEAGRAAKARALFTAFLATPQRSKRLATLRSEAQAFLDASEAR